MTICGSEMEISTLGDWSRKECSVLVCGLFPRCSSAAATFACGSHAVRLSDIQMWVAAHDFHAIAIVPKFVGPARTNSRTGPVPET